MLRWMCKGKIHRATVTDADIDYEGSVTIDANLMKQANIYEHEMVQITNLRNAVLWKTYAIPAPAGSGKICLNGPPALLFQPGDKVIILSMGSFSPEELVEGTHSVVHVDDQNRLIQVKTKKLIGHG
ncbi:aspartate 1-decarboxylase [Heliobacterium chlorum]|uniref:Aspartate 1-decarboxylase n=1 Tax=Heliobacterium chlorum TaxID=2698 RepID=A0ABR7T2L7_HELCL|nr:aspartate 1-decarboxylase [Heliobacterium chlorum]